MDLNTATYSELLTLLNIGEVGAASIVMARDSLKRNGRKLTLVDLTLDCGIPGDIVKEWMVSGEIQPVPRHENSGENEQTAVLLVSIAASIQALSEAVDIVNERQALFESALKAANLDVTGASAHVTNPTGKVEFMSLSRQNSQCQQNYVEELAETQTTSSHHNYEHQDGKPQQSCHQPSSMESDWSDEEFSPSVGGPRSSRADWNRWSRIRVPEFKGNRSSWHSYLVQFNTIVKMNDCHDNEVKVCKLVEALRGKALDYFESLPKELRLEFDSLCSMFEGRFGRQEAPATMRSKLKCITQRVEESLAEFGERALKVASEGYVGMTGQWVQALAVDAFLMGCLDKRSALSSMNKEPQTIDEAVKLMRRLGSHETLKTGKRLCTLEEEDGASAPLQVHHMEASDCSTFEINQLNESIKLLTELLTSTSQKLPLESLGSSGRRAKSFVCFTCGIQGHIARNCPRVSEESKRRKM